MDQGRILDGNLEVLGLQATLKMLELNGKTGVLSVTSGQERLAIFLEGGKIIDLDEPGSTPPDLIDMFRLLGRLPRPQAQELRKLAGANPTTAMMILAQWGMMSEAEVQQRAEFHVIQAISRALRWERGRFELHRDISALQARMSTRKPLNVDHVLLESMRMADEWGRAGAPALTRNTVARWMPEFSGDVGRLGLSREEIGVLCLSNGQFPLHAVSYALLIPEPQVASIMNKLLTVRLIEVVDARLEAELERSLTNILTQSQSQLSQDGRTTPEQRMLVLSKTMGDCINGLLAHHVQYARSLRGRGEASKSELARYLDTTFTPLLTELERAFPRMSAIVRLTENGQLDYHDLTQLDRVVRGQELSDCYWDAVQFFGRLMRMVFDRVINDELGATRAGRQYEDLWMVFQREIDDEISRLAHRRAAAQSGSQQAQHERGRVAAAGQPRAGGAAYVYEMAPEWQKRS